MSNISVTPGIGKTVATETVAAVEYQQVKLIDATAASAAATGVAANPLQVSLANTAANGTAVKTDSSATTQPVSAASLPLPAGASTAAKQPALGTAGAASSDVITIQGVASMTAVKVDNSAVTQPVSGTVAANAGTNLNTSALALESGGNLATIAGSAIAQEATTLNVKGVTAFGAVTTAAPTYTTAKSDALSLTTSGLLRVDGSGVTQPVSLASVPSHAVTNAGTFATQATLQTQTDTIMIGGVNVKEINAVTPLMGTGVTGTGSLRVTIATDQAQLTNKLLVTPDSVALPANQSVNAAQINGVAPLMGNGITGTGSQRVTIASDNTANSNPFLVTQTPATTGGLTTFHLVSAATTNATNIKASAGQVFGWYVYNSNAAARKLVFHNAAGTPTAGALVYFSLVLPPSAGANVFTDSGIPFSTGIAITTVTLLPDTDATAVALNDLIINIWYK